MDKLTEILGEANVFTDRVECLCNSRDMSVHEGIPDAVVFARTTEQVSALMKLAHQEKVPVTARGTGTSVTGAVLPVKGGILLDLHLMNNILEINKADFYARLEPGVVCMPLNAILAKDNLMFPPNPGSEAIATIGGMVSTNASGHRAVKYGTTKDYIKGLKVVMADGTVIETGTTAPKTSLGYDLTHLFCAAEGTLGIITEVIAKLEPKPEYSALATAIFGDLNAAGDAVTEVTTSGIKLAGCEIMDNFSLKVVEEVLGKDVSKIEALLIIEADGVKDVVIRDMNRIGDICAKHGVQEFEWTADPGPRRPGAHAFPHQTGKPPRPHRRGPGRAPHQDPRDHPPGPGHLEKIRRHDHHLRPCGRRKRPHHLRGRRAQPRRVGPPRLKPAVEELVDTAIEMKGTLSAEHGSGLTRMPHMERQLGPSLEVMRQIKQALDPHNILNPGKMSLEDDEGKADIYDFFAFQPLLEHPEGVRSYGETVD
ncbi:MAG: FAD-binding oxidoreductase, partial [Deltaproteobacteria bacterium]|nr:FAD-binding oxidoreductase [Deltaproteobacteria bacterium]